MKAQRLRGVSAAIVWIGALVDVGLVAGVFASIPIPPVFIPGLLATPTSLGIIGALLATRRPRNPIGWIFWAAGLILSSMISASTLPSQTVLSAWLGNVMFTPTFLAVVVFVPLLFPTGGLPARSWRPLAAVVVVGMATLILPNMFGPGPLGGSGIENPVGILVLGPLLDVVRAASGAIALICFAIGAAAPFWRYRRAGPVERQQLKWFAAATAVTAASIPLAAIHLPVISDIAWAGGLLSLGLMPVAIAVAILRYRLYEIDRIISRTISYGVLTAVLVAVFASVVVGLQALLTQFTGSDTLPVAASTLVVFALFQPLRRRVQSAIDRRFARARYDGERTIAAFGTRLRDEVDLTSVVGQLQEVVRATIGPSSASVWLRRKQPGIGR